MTRYSPIHDRISSIFDDVSSKPISTWEDAVRSWETCLTKTCDPQTRSQFFIHLSVPQKACLLVLEEWWWYWCEGWIKLAIASHQADQPTLPLDPTHIACLPQRKLYELWIWEFSGICEDSQVGDARMRTACQTRVRRSAVEAAAVHRTALAIYSWVAYQNTQSNSTLDGDPEKDLQNRLDYHIPACVDPCPWVVQTDEANEYPYYLWDKEDRRTVHFDKDIPAYTVISHTWGRFRIRNQEAVIPNVPWPVPCLDPTLLFDIHSLPDLLSRFPINTRYIWLDLVCIPQDGRPLQAIEIGRQAGIFRAARFAVVWLNQVHDWSGLRSAVCWSSLEYLSQYQDDVYQVKEALLSAKQNASGSLGLTRPAKKGAEGTPESPWILINDHDQTMTPDRWFTSLWTLQEACLRPDMILCNRDWEILSVQAGSSRVPILLDQIIALFSRPQGPRLTHCPPTVYELRLVLNSSNMSTLLTMSPVDILGLGQMRYCANTDRAVAIMSALGTTEWYTKTNTKSSSPKELVGEQYPLTFLREFHKRFGAVMFATLDTYNLQEPFYETPELTEEDIEPLRGSMLPFSKGMQEPRFMSVELVSHTDHPSVRDWVIRSDGSVKIEKVSIIASSHEDRHIAATILPRQKTQEERSSDLLTWMTAFRPESEKFAVCLLRNMTNIYRGAILERVKSDENHFVNVGIFFTNEADPSSLADFDFNTWTDVDWIVL